MESLWRRLFRNYSLGTSAGQRRAVKAKEPYDHCNADFRRLPVGRPGVQEEDLGEAHGRVCGRPETGS